MNRAKGPNYSPQAPYNTYRKLSNESSTLGLHVVSVLVCVCVCELLDLGLISNVILSPFPTQRESQSESP